MTEHNAVCPVCETPTHTEIVVCGDNEITEYPSGGISVECGANMVSFTKEEIKRFAARYYTPPTPAAIRAAAKKAWDDARWRDDKGAVAAIERIITELFEGGRP